MAHARPESSTVSRCCINDLTKAPASYSQSPTCAHHDQQNGSRNLGTSAAGRSQSQRGAAAAPPGRRAAAERWRRGRAGRKTGQAQTRTHGQQGARSPAPCFPPRPRRQGRPLRGRGASASPVLSRCRRSPGRACDSALVPLGAGDLIVTCLFFLTSSWQSSSWDSESGFSAAAGDVRRLAPVRGAAAARVSPAPAPAPLPRVPCTRDVFLRGGPNAGRLRPWLPCLQARSSGASADHAARNDREPRRR